MIRPIVPCLPLASCNPNWFPIFNHISRSQRGKHYKSWSLFVPNLLIALHIYPNLASSDSNISKNSEKITLQTTHVTKGTNPLTRHQNLQDAQLLQRDRAAGCVIVSPKVEDWNWETIFYGHYSSSFNHCDLTGLKIYRIR